jgi:hypothetical protein
VSVRFYGSLNDSLPAQEQAVDRQRSRTPDRRLPLPNAAENGREKAAPCKRNIPRTHGRTYRYSNEKSRSAICCSDVSQKEKYIVLSVV